MVPYIYTAIILLCFHISGQQCNVNGIALENSLDDQFNFMIESPYMTTAEYNSSSSLQLQNLASSFSTFMSQKSNKPVSKLCNLNTVSVENGVVRV